MGVGVYGQEESMGQTGVLRHQLEVYTYFTTTGGRPA